MAVDIEVIWVRREAKYFCKGGWTGFSDLPVGRSSIATGAVMGSRYSNI
jgi:hypothetical protein